MHVSGNSGHLLFLLAHHLFIFFWLHHLDFPLGNHLSSTLSPCGVGRNNTAALQGQTHDLSLAYQGILPPCHPTGSGLGMPPKPGQQTQLGLAESSRKVPILLPLELLLIQAKSY